MAADLPPKWLPEEVEALAAVRQLLAAEIAASPMYPEVQNTQVSHTRTYPRTHARTQSPSHAPLTTPLAR